MWRQRDLCKRDCSSTEDGKHAAGRGSLHRAGKWNDTEESLQKEGGNTHTSSNCPQCFSPEHWRTWAHSSLSCLLLCFRGLSSCFIGPSGLFFFSLETGSLWASNSWNQGWPKLLIPSLHLLRDGSKLCTTTFSFIWSNKATFPQFSVFIFMYCLFVSQCWGLMLGTLGSYFKSSTPELALVLSQISKIFIIC